MLPRFSVRIMRANVEAGNKGPARRDGDDLGTMVDQHDAEAVADASPSVVARLTKGKADRQGLGFGDRLTL
jgi:hypothetical protein